MEPPSLYLFCRICAGLALYLTQLWPTWGQLVARNQTLDPGLQHLNFKDTLIVRVPNWLSFEVILVILTLLCRREKGTRARTPFNHMSKNKKCLKQYVNDLLSNPTTQISSNFDLSLCVKGRSPLDGVNRVRGHTMYK